MSDTCHLRDACPTDAGKVGAILSEFATTTPWFPRLYTEAEDIAHAGRMIDLGWVRVAEQEDAGVVAFLARDGKDVASLFVARHIRGRGVGRQLLNDAKSGRDRLELWTHVANDARGFYLREGFVEVERTDGSRNEENLPDVRLVWERTSQQ